MAQSCDCGSGGLNLSGNIINLSDLVSGAQLPSGSSNIGCISVPANANLNVDINYTFSGTTFNMAYASRVTVLPGARLTLENSCHLKNCDDDPYGWVGIVVQGGGEIDMSGSVLENGTLRANHRSKIRLVDNYIKNGVYGLFIQGYVSFINFENPNDFSGNYFVNCNYSIFLDHATYFYIGDKNSNSATIVNTVDNYTSKSGIGIRMDGCQNIGIYGMNITGYFESLSNDERRAIHLQNCANITIKYCNIYPVSPQPPDGVFGFPAYGIYFKNCFGVLKVTDNVIVALGVGIYFLNDVDFSLNHYFFNNNDISGFTGIQVDNFSKDNQSNLEIKDNTIDHQLTIAFPFNYFRRGIMLNRLDLRYQIEDNIINEISPPTSIDYPNGSYVKGIDINFCTGQGDIYHNTLTYDIPEASSGIEFLKSQNIKVTVNNLTGMLQDENRPGSHGIAVTNCTNLGFCCNSVDATDFGTQFASANNDIKYLTTTFGEHDSALYFPPAAALNKQLNTGNDWGDAATTFDAFYEGSLAQAQSNAPFRTSTSNINAAKVRPSGWFVLAGSDPYCGQLDFTCIEAVSQDSTSITDRDSSALTNVGVDNEYVLRFEQQRQLYRKLKENPDLIAWNGDISDFYYQADTGIIGAFDSLDQHFRRLGALSAGLDELFAGAMEYLDSLSALAEAIEEAYPGASAGEKEDLREEMDALGAETSDVLNGLDSLYDQAAGEFQENLARLLASNDSLQTTETWETNEKDINVLLFKYFGRMIDTFTNTEKQQIIELAEACPQYEGAGVYKARLLRGTFVDSTFAGYHESQCVPAESKPVKTLLPAKTGDLAVYPNPAGGRVFIRFEKATGPDGLLSLDDLTGRNVLTASAAALTETSIPLDGVAPGLYLLTYRSAGSAPKSVKLIISR